ncbi:hypothetical protein [Streptomyces sp. NPDC018352]|uniref:hypothetical protein n=1 Tax=Streptomyces sp. NPDC018352 TaxID=3157194 RepID=UPI0033CBFB4B
MSADEISAFGVLCTLMGGLAAVLGLAAGALTAEVRNRKKGPCKRCSSPTPDQLGS